MEIYFKDKNTREVIDGIQDKLGGRKLGDLLEIEAVGEDIRVTIRKMGTSTLEFSHRKEEDGHSWELSKEKLALTHRAFKNEILAKLTHIIDSMGGKVIS
jgi:hypothetical protein